MAAIAELVSGSESLSAERCIEIFGVLVRARVLEERMIRMTKSGQSSFWIGGPGEEALNTCLGLQVNKGRGPAYDYLHFHYRSLATLLAMGMSMLDAVRQAAMTVTDPHSMGRNFVGHFAYPPWNVVPVNSIVGIQFAVAPGTARVQRRHGGDGVSVVVGGDAGTAQRDFASCLTWSSRPGQELPVLMIVTNNQWGISTALSTQHSVPRIADRGAAHGIPGETIDGNDPIASWYALRRAFRWCRSERRPFLLEAIVSRLHGHSSSSGAVRTHDQRDCVQLFQRRLVARSILTQDGVDQIWDAARGEADQAVETAVSEPQPTADDVLKHTYAPSPVDSVYPEDYTGLPDGEIRISDSSPSMSPNRNRSSFGA